MWIFYFEFIILNSILHCNIEAQKIEKEGDTSQDYTDQKEHVSAGDGLSDKATAKQSVKEVIKQQTESKYQKDCFNC